MNSGLPAHQTAGEGWAAAAAACPKRMRYGPCAGVLDGDGDGDDRDGDRDGAAGNTEERHGVGACEVPGFGPCAFLPVLADGWRPGRLPEPPPTGAPLNPAAAAARSAAGRRALIVADLPAPPCSGAGLRASAAELSGVVDACLLGDHGGARVQFPPSYRARLMAEAGVGAWVGINCRDRNRVALDGELAACADAGAVAVHCVTGDHQALGHRPDSPGVFDLDSLELVALAAGRGMLCSVAHAPTARPRPTRLPRLLAKARAGADVVFVDHCGGPGPVGAAVAALRAAGFAGLVLACVPVVTDAATAAVVASFAADRLPPGHLAAILGADDPAAAGIAATIELALATAALPGVDGVNLSGGTEPGQELTAARALGTVGRQLRERLPAG